MSFNDKLNLFKFNLSKGRTRNAHTGDGAVTVPMFSDFFAGAETSPLYTNGMYEGFKQEIISSVELYKTRDDITMMIYEAEPVNDLSREVVLVGFRKYIAQCVQKQKKYVSKRTVLFSLLAALGVFCIYFSNAPWAGGIAPWVLSCINNVGCVFLWNFLGYFAFEFSGDERELNRLRQIHRMQYSFRKWE